MSIFAKRRLRMFEKRSELSRTTRYNELKRQDIFKRGISKRQVIDLLETDKYVDLSISKKQKEKLEDDGWIVVSSSNVIAVKKDGKHLIVKFVGDRDYKWTNSAKFHYPRILKSVSKGRYVHKALKKLTATKI